MHHRSIIMHHASSIIKYTKKNRLPRDPGGPRGTPGIPGGIPGRCYAVNRA